MKHTLLQVDLELLLWQECDDARDHKVDEGLRVAVLAVLKSPLALVDDKAEDLDLTLSILVSVSCRLPTTWNAFEKHRLVASYFFGDVFKNRNEDGKQAHIFTGFVDDVLTDKDGLFVPVVCDVSQEKVTCSLVDLVLLCEP